MVTFRQFLNKFSSEQDSCNALSESYVGGFKNGFRYVFEYPTKKFVPGRIDYGIMTVDVYGDMVQICHRTYVPYSKKWDCEEYEISLERFENEILPYLSNPITVEEIEQNHGV